MSSQKSSLLARHGAKFRLVAIGLLVLSILMLMAALPFDVLVNALEREVKDLGALGPLVFIVVYIVATVLLIPASLLTAGAGVIFGLGLGLATVSVASTTGAALSFLIARYLARSRVEKIAEQNPKFGAIDAAISEGGWKIVAMLRLSPAIPFGLQNYLYGLTKIGFVPYVITSWIAMLPGTLLYVYLGLVGKKAAGGGGGTSVGQWVLLAVGLLATIGVTVYITRLAQAKLAERSEVADAGVAEEANSTVKPGSLVKLFVVALTLLALALFAGSRSEQLSEKAAEWVGAPAADQGP